jgi:hypothetical protein
MVWSRSWRWYRSRRPRTQWALGIGAAFAALFLMGAQSPAEPAPATQQPVRTAATAPPTTPRAHQKAAAHRRTHAAATRGDALRALAALPVKGRAPKTGYSREQFGDGWATVAGCDTRDRILRRDLTRKVYKAGDDCAVQSGRLDDPYTATAITFVRGGASEVDIDHVVALSDAWQKGAQRWSAGKRVAFANDPLNLLSVDAHVNRAKVDGDAATWLPPNKRFRCSYVARQVAVKRKFTLWLTRAERDAIARVLARCPAQKLPRAGALRVPVVPTDRAPAPSPAPSPDGDSGHGRVFANCDAVRAAGLAPLLRGSADYAANPQLDRDKDGVACEG